MTDQSADTTYGHLTDEELGALISDLQAVQASRQATAQQTTVEHEPGADPEDES